MPRCSKKNSKRLFDSVGRLDRQSVYVNTTEKAYTRYEYPTNGIQSKSYTPEIDVDGDSNITEDEVYSDSWFDGAGRVRGSRTEHPGSTGGWTATQTEYNVLGPPLVKGIRPQNTFDLSGKHF